MSMFETIISFETAKLAKEKGFEEYCFSYYDLKGNKKDNYLENGSSTDVEFRVDLEDLLDNFNRGIPNTYSAPTQSLLQKWLREVHNKEVFVVCTVKNDDTKGKYISNKFMIPFTQAFKVEDLRDTWEEAFEEGLIKALTELS